MDTKATTPITLGYGSCNMVNLKYGFLLLVQVQVGLYSACYRATNHGVVADTQEAHHLHVSGY